MLLRFFGYLGQVNMNSQQKSMRNWNVMLFLIRRGENLYVIWTPCHVLLLSYICAVSMRTWKRIKWFRSKIPLITRFSENFLHFCPFQLVVELKCCWFAPKIVNTVDGIKKEKDIKKIIIFFVKRTKMEKK